MSCAAATIAIVFLLAFALRPDAAVDLLGEPRIDRIGQISNVVFDVQGLRNGQNSGFLVVSANIIGVGGFTLTGEGGLLDLLGTNSFTGLVVVNDGQLVAGHATAFGTTDAGVELRSFGRLLLANVNVGAEPLVVFDDVFSDSDDSGRTIGTGATAGTGTTSPSGTSSIGTTAGTGTASPSSTGGTGAIGGGTSAGAAIGAGTGATPAGTLSRFRRWRTFHATT